MQSPAGVLDGTGSKGGGAKMMQASQLRGQLLFVNGVFGGTEGADHCIQNSGAKVQNQCSVSALRSLPTELLLYTHV